MHTPKICLYRIEYHLFGLLSIGLCYLGGKEEWKMEDASWLVLV